MCFVFPEYALIYKYAINYFYIINFWNVIHHSPKTTDEKLCKKNPFCGH